MAEKECYLNVTALDTDIDIAKKAFEAGAREFSSTEGLSSPQRREEVSQTTLSLPCYSSSFSYLLQMWNNFRSRSYKNLCENVTEYGGLVDAKVLNGKDDMPAELQRKVCYRNYLSASRMVIDSILDYRKCQERLRLFGP